jgi:Ser/Thr protein kinase RdoA (MazF antagonist)
VIPPFDPTPAQLAALAQVAGLGTVRQARLVKRQNDLWRLETSAGPFYLKAYTKDWYGDDLAATAGCVQHEAGAYALLATLGLSGPEVRSALLDAAVLGRPALPGQPLTPTAVA